MKEKCIAILFLFISMCVSAQITNIYGPDSSFVLKRLYAGMIQATNFSVDSLSVNNWTGFRAGANVTYSINKTFGLNAFFAMDQNSDGVSGTVNSFVFETRLGKKFLWVNGLGPQVSAWFHRPPPVSFTGHFEPWTKAQLPGGALSSRFEIGVTNKVVGSIARKNNQAEFHLGFNYKQKFLTSVWINQNQDSWGGAITLNLKKISTTAFLDQNHLGYFAWITLPKDWGVYLDIGFEYTEKEIPRGEFGVLKSYKIKNYKLGGIIGGGYSYEQRAVRGYLTIALSD
jgi:hypothetical protein